MPGVLRPAARGSYEGALAWLTFGLLEHLCLSVLPAWRESSLLLTPASRLGALAALLAAYTLFGALAGAIAGAAFPARAAGAGPATVVLAWIPHLVAARGFSRSAHLALAVAVLLLAVLALRAWRPRPAWDRLTAWLASPAGVSLCLLAPLVFRDQLHLSPLAARLGPAASAFKAIVAAAGTLLLILLLAAGARAWSSRRRPARAWLRLATPFVLAAAILSGAWLLDARALGRVAEPGRAPGGAGAGGVLGAHASLFTGTYPGRHGAWVGGAFPFGRPLAPSVRTLAERLGDAGWVRFASVANGYFLNRAYGLSRGFQLFDVPAEDRLELRSRVRGLIARLSGGAAPVNRPAREVNGVLLAGLEAARAGGRPFLAFANYMEAHAPRTRFPATIPRCRRAPARSSGPRARGASSIRGSGDTWCRCTTAASPRSTASSARCSTACDRSASSTPL
ncbi:MAG: Arylsulfatase [Acidobacteria bacterium]|nr:Arylsulfatase [Acidobacteriota bacterium]